MTRVGFLAAALATVALVPRVDAADPAHDAIEKASQSYAAGLKAMDTAALVALYADDGELRNPGMDTLKGKDAIRKFLDSLKGAKVEASTMSTDAIDVAGDVAIQWGTYTQKVAPPNQPLGEFRGRYVAQWARQADGRWLLKRMLAQPGPPPEPKN